MPKKGEVVKTHLCETCGERNPTNFNPRMKGTCKKCHTRDIERRRVSRRELAIEYKGGKCEHCGYNKFRGALEFHHKDPTLKDPQGLKAVKLSKLFAEVDKCLLLCANCHREEHDRIRYG